MSKSRYEIFEAKHHVFVGSFKGPTLLSDDSHTVEWEEVKKIVNEVSGASWARGVFDLEMTNKMWLVDYLGRMTHFMLSYTIDEFKAEKGSCPKCGNRGEFIRMALTCPFHGVFGGC